MDPDDTDENDTLACPDCDASGYDDEDGSPCGRCGGLGCIESAHGVALPDGLNSKGGQ